jgi:hypothetical protein
MLAYTNDPVVADENLFSTDPPLDANLISGFIFEGDSGSLFFTSVELFGAASGTPFDIYIDEGSTWVFEASSAFNLPYTFSEFGGVDEFKVLFNDPQLANIFDNLIVDVTFDSDGTFDGTITPIISGTASNVPEPSSVWIMTSGLLFFSAYWLCRRGRADPRSPPEGMRLDLITG